MSRHYLDRFFNPRSVALVGASDSPDSVGALVLRNLLAGGYEGRIHPVNPAHGTVGGLVCAASVRDLPEVPDLAVLAIPPRHVPKVLDQCGRQGISAALILAADLHDPRGGRRDLRGEILATARRHQIRLIGPDWVGLMRPVSGLNAAFTATVAQRGRLALVSQSGAITSAVVDWASSRHIGFSAVVSLGDATDVDFGDVLDFLALDPETRSILLYVEQVQDARGFLSGLRAAARLKPVIVMKTGRHHQGTRSTGSHASALVGPDQAFDAALARAGAVRVPTIGQLFASAELLSSGRRLAGDRIAVLANGSGPGQIAADLLSDRGLSLATFTAETHAALADRLAPALSRSAPLDMPCDITADDYGRGLNHCLADSTVDGAVAIFTPQARGDANVTAEAVIREAEGSRKPVLACWMGGNRIRDAREQFIARRFPNYATPENAVEALAALSRYRHSQALLMQLSQAPGHTGGPDVAAARAIIRAALEAGHSRLTPAQSKAVLQAFRIPVIPTLVACSATEASEAARKLGLPVALKINTAEIRHKAACGGVRLNLVSPEAVENAWQDIMTSVAAHYPAARPEGCSVEPMHNPMNGREIMLGVARDPVFGPVLSFGAGGSMVEAIEDFAVSLPPLNDFLARDLVMRTRVARHAGDNADDLPVKALETALLQLSDLVCSLPEVTDVDINPMIVDSGTAVAVDARIHIQRAEDDQAYGHMAIMPYPAHLARTVTLRDGESITLRPIRPEDACMEADFVRSLSPRSRYLRFMEHMNELSTSMLIRFTQIDYDREMAFVALAPVDGAGKQVGVVRYVINPDGSSCEFALVVADDWQGRGLGRLLMSTIMDAARARGLHRIEGQVLAGNHAMLRLMGRLGFHTDRDADDPQLVNVSRALDETAGHPA